MIRRLRLGIIPIALVVCTGATLSCRRDRGLPQSGEASTPTPQAAELSFRFSPVSIGEKSELACRAISSLSVGQKDVLSEAAADRIVARIDAGTDRLAVRIESRYIVFLTGAAMEAGQAEGSRFPLIENTGDHLKAVETFDTGAAVLETFVLNKRNGLAIWTKVHPAGILAKVVPAAPESQVIYFRCY